MAKRGEDWDVGGREVRVTNLDKIFWPEQGITKGDLLRYYRDVAPKLLPFMQDRPFIMRAWPNGITGKSFDRWRVPAHAPDWLERFTYQLQTANRTAEMAVVDDPPELIWTVNQGVIEMHPWAAPRQHPERPNLLFFDLDPVQGVEFSRVLEVGAWIGEMLDEIGLRGAPKTSGGDGLHIFIPVEPRYSFEEVREWLGRFIERLEERHPDAVTADKRLAARGGKVLIDYSQNALGKSIVAPYSLRAKPGAPISTPISWEEVRKGKVRPLDFTLTSMPKRRSKVDKAFQELLPQAQALPSLEEPG